LKDRQTHIGKIAVHRFDFQRAGTCDLGFAQSLSDIAECGVQAGKLDSIR
jgi:hypothetical protein